MGSKPKQIIRSIDDPWEKDAIEEEWPAELLKINNDEWEIWVQPVSGMSIKTIIPKQPFDLMVGDEFVWCPKSCRGKPKEWTMEELLEQEKIGLDIEKFRQKRILRELKEQNK